MPESSGFLDHHPATFALALFVGFIAGWFVKTLFEVRPLLAWSVASGTFGLVLLLGVALDWP